MEIPLLGELETAVLEHLWSSGAAEAKDVHRALGTERSITLSTIQSTLERLHRKQLVRREKFSHAYRYESAMSRNEFRALAMASAAGDLRTAESAGALAAFVDLMARTDHTRLDDLASLIEQARNRSGTRNNS